GDGDPDLIAQGAEEQNNERPRLFLFRNDGSGTFEPATDIFPAGLTGGGLALADLDRDGDADIAATGFDETGTPRFLIFENDGTGRFTLSEEPRGPNHGYGSGSVVVGNLRGKGKKAPEIVVSGDGVDVYRRSKKNGPYELYQNLVPASEGAFNHRMRLADLDCDKDLDLVTFGRHNLGDNERVLALQFTNHKGVFSADAATLLDLDPSHDPFGLDVGDTNGDGHADAFFSSHSSPGATFNPFLFYFQNDRGTLFEVEQLPTSFVGPVIIADFDSDGDNDLVGLPVRHLYENLSEPTTTKRKHGKKCKGKGKRRSGGDSDSDSDTDSDTDSESDSK
ncbi:MAG: FG-GAP repeat domain-containing protein, partial [Planctomycetota bacterium]